MNHPRASMAPHDKHWTVSASDGTVKRLAMLFAGEEVKIAPELQLERRIVREMLTAVENELTLRRYTAKTHEAYLGHLRRFLRHFRQAPATFPRDEVRAYLLDLVRNGRVSRTYKTKM